MTNEEIKKKIVEILNDVTTEPMIYKGRYLGDTQIPELKINAIADVLIAAGLTFDKTTAILDERTNGKTLILKAQYYDQMKHRAEVAERALKIAEDLGELCDREEVRKETAREIVEMLIGHEMESEGWTWIVSQEDVAFIAEKYGIELFGKTEQVEDEE